MLLRSITLFSMLSVLISAASTGLAQESLAWKFQPGESLRYVVQLSTVMDMSVAGQKAQSIHNTQTMDMVWKVASVEPDGVAKMIQAIERVQVKTEGGPLGLVQYDSSSTETLDARQKSVSDMFVKIIGQEFGITMMPTGKISEVTVPDALTKSLTDAGPNSMLTKETVKEMMKQSAVTLPVRPVSTGEAWENNQAVELPFGTMLVKSILTYEGTEAGSATIDMKPQIEVKPKEGAPITLKLTKSEGDGKVQFDVARGRISKSELELILDLQVTKFGKTIDMTLRQSTKMNLAE